MFLLIDNYDSFTYNLYALFLRAGCKVNVIKNKEFINADIYNGIIISPGPSTPLNSGITLQYLKNYIGKKPIFGVCLGMQAIGYIKGFSIKQANTIKHGKVDEIKVIKNSILFENITQFKSVRYHSLAVKIEESDKYVTAIAKSDNEIMAIENVEEKFFGVQFHPESFLSENGLTIIKNFINFASGGF